MTCPTLLPAGHRIPAGLTYSTVRPDLDFETYSEAGKTINLQENKVTGKGLLEVGTAVYAEHPTADILCFSYDLKDGLGKRRWFPGCPDPVDLLEHIAAGGDIAAHNATFEWYIWNMICYRKYGWPPLQFAQLYCDQAKARRHSLPAALGKLCEVLGTADKDKRGQQLIRELCMPSKKTKNKQYFRRTPATDWDKFEELYNYCDQDIHSEACAAALVPDLTPYERAAWLNDQYINARGVQLDMPSLDACLRVLEDATVMYTAELVQITCGHVGTVDETAKFVAWVNAQGIPMADLKAETVEGRLAKFSKMEEAAADPAIYNAMHTIDQESVERYMARPHVKRVLEIRSILGGANVKKLHTYKRMASSDGRLRNQYTYCTAHTGRSGANGAQLQNITGKGPAIQTCTACGRIAGKRHVFESMGSVGACPDCGDLNAHFDAEWGVEAVEYALADIRSYDGGLLTLVAKWGDPAALLAGCLRGLLIAKKDHELVCCDFSAIEAVVLACLSRCQWRIEVFSTHGKIYEKGASEITGTPFAEMMAHAGYTDLSIPNWWEAEQTGEHHGDRKKIGKVSELASGYGGWIGAWIAFGADKFMSEDEIKAAILAWRAASPEIVELWGGQHRQIGPKPWDSKPELFGFEGMFVKAVQNPGQCFHYIDISFAMYGDVLYIRLPSGRFLHYHQPRLTAGVDHFRRPSQNITFMGWNSNSQKGRIGWILMETYGGRLAENVTQAVAADIQFESIGRLQDRGIPVVMHTHDENSAEVPVGSFTVEESVAVMTERPSWASWWPIRADGWHGKRFRK